MSADIPLPKVHATPRASDFAVGLLTPFRSIAIVRRHPSLRRFARWMAVVTAVSLIALAYLLARSSDDLLGLFWARPEGWFGAALWTLTVVLLFLALFAICATIVPPLLLVPLQDPLSECVEALITGRDAAPFSIAMLVRGTITGLHHTLARLAILIGGLIALLPLHLLPGLGSVIYTVLATSWSVLWLAAEHIGSPMARHLFAWSAVLDMLRARLPLFLGFGLGCHVLLWVPVLNFFFLPYAIVGGTLLFCALREAGAMPNRE